MTSETPESAPVLACVPLNTQSGRVSKYASEAPISKADRDKAKASAKARKSTLYALTVVCYDEQDQKKLFTQAARVFPGRRIRVVVS